MAYDFNGVSGRYLDSSAPNISAYPSTISYWIKLTNVSITSQIFSWHIWTSSVDHFIIRLLVTNTSRGRISVLQPGLGPNADTTSTLSNNTWHHICAVLTSSVSRTVYLDGANSATSTVSISPTGMNTIYIGNSVAPNTGTLTANTTLGAVSDVGIWSVALNTDEINSLAKGFSPKRIRPQSLEYDVPLIRNLYDYNSNISLTNNNSVPVSDHNRIYS